MSRSQLQTLLLAGSVVTGPLLLMGCGGILEQTPDYTMGVPYRAQEQYNYCVPASILMWRLYDGLPEVSQTTIFNAIGGAPCDGLDAADGVALYTTSGSDVYYDLLYTPTEHERDQLIARQITSIDRAVPVIAVAPRKNHVGVINGGKYIDMGTHVQWEFLYFHDPDSRIGADRKYSGGDWLSAFCEVFDSRCAQVISGYASSGWQAHFDEFSDSVSVYGGGGGCLPSECGPLPE